MLADVIVIQIDILSLNGQRAAIRHGIAGINCKVHDHLFYLSGVHFYIPELRIQNDAQFDTFSYYPAEHFFDVGYHGIEVKNDRFQNLLSAKCEKLARELGRPGTRVLDLRNVSA